MKKGNAILLLADGTVFYGHGIGITGKTHGELCFNTGMTGYQEVLSDPSYAGQIITFTFPHIGNIGTNEEDMESFQISARGLIIRSNITSPSNYRNEQHLNKWLYDHKITGICGIDTRALTRKIRTIGAMNAMIFYTNETCPPVTQLLEELREIPSLEGIELAKSVMTNSDINWRETIWNNGFGEIKNPKYHIVAMDFGAKHNILRSLVSLDCKVTLIAGNASFSDIMDLAPDGVFLSNGPGDPAATAKYAMTTINKLITNNVPIFGICLGHQLLAIAMGAVTKKMHQGHRGANHPVKNIQTGAIEITSQNHGFVVTSDNFPDYLEITHISLFDGTIEGIKHREKPIFSVQYHPESSPGPHDSHYLFAEFIEAMQ